MEVNRALISVWDKTGAVEFARELRELGIDIVSTRGTASVLKEKGIEVKEASEITNFPEILNGRVKTLHPKIHGGSSLGEGEKATFRKWKSSASRP